jgi:MoaA/NifB/PqqE/SkfB family radical SAM enzyme
VFLLTERCNARCLHCDIWKNTGKEETPTLEQYKTVLSDLRNWLGTVQVTFSGGEALIKPYTIDLVAYGSSLGLFQEILTHGYWEDQSKIERLALARPWRITISFDGIGETHTKVRGRDKFWERTSRTIETLKRMRKEHSLPYTILLKNVIMSHNLHDTLEVAKFAHSNEGMEVFYQAIEQNYNTAEDPQWYLHSDNWPKDTAKAVETVRRLIGLKKEGYPILNSLGQLDAMAQYFENPEASRVAIMSHSAHEKRRSCSALLQLQFQSNGDITVCTGAPPVGNIKNQPIRQIWEQRPHLWEQGCCLDKRCTNQELEHTIPAASLVSLGSGKESQSKEMVR